MVSVLSLGATIGWAAVLWCLFVLGTVCLANVKQERSRRSRRTRSVSAREIALGWALVVVAYLLAAATLWALWQLGHGRWWS